jgi:hypothetical protein
MNGTITSLTDAILGYLLFTSSIAAISIPAALAIIKLARIRAAVHRYMVWLYTLVTITFLPAFCLYCPKLPLPVLPERIKLVNANDVRPVAVYPAVESTQTTPEEPRFSPSMPTGSLPPIHSLPNTKMHFFHAKEIPAGFIFIASA